MASAEECKDILVEILQDELDLRDSSFRETTTLVLKDLSGVSYDSFLILRHDLSGNIFDYGLNDVSFSTDYSRVVLNAFKDTFKPKGRAELS